jgi:hypothetical protein
VPASFARLLEHLESCNVKGYLIRYVARNPFLEVKFTPRHQESPRDQVVWTFLLIPELLKKVNKIIVHIFTFRSSTSGTHWECSDEGHHDEEIDVDICDDRLRRKSRLGAERSNNLSTKSSTGGKKLKDKRMLMNVGLEMDRNGQSVMSFEMFWDVLSSSGKFSLSVSTVAMEKQN